jgi:hypothetical protein
MAELLTIAQAAAVLCVSPRTVYRLIADRELNGWPSMASCRDQHGVVGIGTECLGDRLDVGPMPVRRDCVRRIAIF